MHNQLILEGKLVTNITDIITQDGKVIYEFIIEHNSQVTEFGAERCNILRIRIYAQGNQFTEICRCLSIGSRVGIVGYLSRHLKPSAVKDFELVVKAQAIELLS